MTHMPWGKFVGQPLRDLPLAYLQWLARQAIQGELATAVLQEVARRQREQQASFQQQSRSYSFHSTNSQQNSYYDFFSDFFGRRQANGQAPPRAAAPTVPSVPPELRQIIADIVKTGFRTEAKRTHADNGGTGDMDLLRQAKDWLVEVLKLNDAA